MKNNLHIILASKSPRRKEILALLGLEFEIRVSNLPEESEEKNPIKLAQELSKIKAENIFNETEGDRVVIGSDTIVVSDGQILGKPKDKADAKKMIKSLSGKTHSVVTGFCIIIYEKGQKKVVVDFDEAKVKFAKMTNEEIEYYINTTEPYDKAGAYAVQGIGSRYIEKLDGNYFTVMGLPIQKLYKSLRENNIM